MPDQSVQAYGPFIFQNSLGISGETQGVLRRNLIPKTRSLRSADHALSVDLQCRPARQPVWLRWTHRRVGRAQGEGQGHLWHYPRPEEEAEVWLILPVCADSAVSISTPPSSLPLFPVIPELWRNGSDLILQKRPGH